MKNYNFNKSKAVPPLIMCLMVFLVSCGQGLPQTLKEVGIGWSEIDQGVGLEIGDILEVSLPATPSTGCIWEVGFYNQSVLKPLGEPEFYNLTTDLGGEEIQKLHFEAIDEGETDLVFVYRQTFENEGIDEKIFQIHVIEN